MVSRVAGLLDRGKLTWEAWEKAAIELEESSSKTVFLFRLTSEDVQRLQNHRALTTRARRLNSSYSDTPIVVLDPPRDPTLVYLTNSASAVRTKFAETQKRVDVDLVRQTFRRLPVKKVIVANGDFETGILQVRFDSAEDLHSHLDSSGRPREAVYRSFYLGQISTLLACSLTPLDLRPILKELSEKEPRVLELLLNKVRTSHNSKIRITNPGDVRDDPDWQAARTSGGPNWDHEQAAGEWLAAASAGQLTRNIFTYFDAVAGTLRFPADCHDSEIEYAVTQIASF
jgi:hypothetical protein